MSSPKKNDASGTSLSAKDCTPASPTDLSVLPAENLPQDDEPDDDAANDTDECDLHVSPPFRFVRAGVTWVSRRSRFCALRDFPQAGRSKRAGVLVFAVAISRSGASRLVLQKPELSDKADEDEAAREAEA